MAAIIDYDEAVARYQQGLATTLRGFSPGLPFLDGWVPDEDAAKGILNMAEAALAAGLDEITMRVSAVRLPMAARPALGQELSQMGAASLDDHEGACRIHLRFAGGAAQSRPLPAVAPAAVTLRPEAKRGTEPERARELPAAYRALVAEAARHPAHAGEAAQSARAGSVACAAEESGRRLSLAVDPATHGILAARYSVSGAGADLPGDDTLWQGLLEALCTLLEGLPLDEAGDHAVIRLEHALRDESAAPPVAGVVTPESAHACFAALTQLLRAATAGYRQATGWTPGDNRYDPPPSASWRALSEGERRERIQAVIDERCVAAGLPPGAARCENIERGERVVVRFAQRTEPQAMPRGQLDRWARVDLLWQIERALRRDVDGALYVLAPDRYDENSIRRL